MASFKELKKSRTKQISKFVEKSEKETGSSFQSDDRFWSITQDKAGNGAAVIRFLPSPPGKGEDFPWVRVFSHFFRGKNNAYYVENSLTTLGENDPVSEYNTYLWNKNEDDKSPERRQARDQKRRLVYISNILVVNDPANPENNGKVFLYRYGKKLFDKIKDMMEPDDPLGKKEPINPFDAWEGVDFNLRVKKVKVGKQEYNNYDDSTFDSEPTPLGGVDDDDAIEEIWKQAYSLQAFVAPDQFKSYDELKRRLNAVLGIDLDSILDRDSSETNETSENDDDVSEDEFEETESEDEDTEEEDDSSVEEDPDEDDDDDVAYFKNLAKG